MENTPEIDPCQTLAGFRLVRRIGTGSRSTVHLGLAVGEQGEARSAALKVFRVDADRPALDRQVRAMLGVPPAMLPCLRDVATAPDGRLCLVLDRLAGSSLQRLLDDRGRIGAGEVVTILATITATLQALHDAGFSHPMVGPACVRFDDGGRPVLLGLGALDDLPAGAGGVARRRDDLVRLAGFARSVLDHLDPLAPESATALSALTAFESTATARPFPRDLTGVEAALFEWAPATAVRGAMPGVRNADLEATAEDPDPSRQQGALTLTARAAGTPDVRTRKPGVLPDTTGLAERREPAGRPLRRWVAESRSRVRTVRCRWRATVERVRASRPVLVGAGLAVVLTAGAWAVLTWSESQGGRGDSSELSGASPRSSPGAAGSTPPAPVNVDHSPVEGDDEGGAGQAGQAAALVADDPAAATLALLHLRDGCLAAASVLCLDGVDQAGSVAMAADSYHARQAEGGAGGSTGEGATVVERSPAFTAKVQERRGNAALIVLTPVAAAAAGEDEQPASALVIKGEAGWRLRELFDY